MNDNEVNSLIGCCGIYCGLCSKYQSKAPSRCLGCKEGEQHAWCSIWNCCVKKHGYVICAECSEVFQCALFLRRKVAEWFPAADNLRQIREVGIKNWLKGQKERQQITEELLEHYNEGRSLSFYCKACARIPIKIMNRAIDKAEKTLTGRPMVESDMKSRAKILKASIEDLSNKHGIRLD